MYGVCDFVVLSVVEVCVDYGGMNVVIKRSTRGYINKQLLKRCDLHAS